jgi:hypothetical protein
VAAIPHSWEAYARLQRRLARTTNIGAGAALEAALNVVHSANFKPEDLTDEGSERVAATAGRRERDHLRLLRSYGTADHTVRSQSLDHAVHAERELFRLKTMMPERDWELLVGIAAGFSYEVLAAEIATGAASLRSRVCRLRQAII